MLVTMTSRPAATVLGPLLVLLAGLTGGCAGGPPTVSPSGVDGLVVPTPSPEPGDFVGQVDNPWFPLVPGTVRSYRSIGAGGPQRVTTTVAHRTREVQGVRTVVVHDRVTGARGRLVEDTYDWFAQDTAGNVWYFGEDTTSYGARGRGRPDTEGSWEAGVDGAEAGLAMPAHPRVGDGYAEEHLAGVAEDQAEVQALDASVEVPAGSYRGLLRTEDTTPLEPGLVEWKLYARGVGLVLEETVSGVPERVELVRVRRP